jgi:uncharacterized lipoprotein YmbA
MMRTVTVAAVAAGIALALAGCSRSPQVVFYTLAPEAKVAAAPAAAAGPSVVVGPVSIPELIDRPQLVVRTAPNRVDILEMHRWAEPLKDELPALLAQNLGRLLGSTRVSSYRQYAGAALDLRVLVDLLRFEAKPGEGVTVEANWTIRGTAGAAQTGHSLITEQADDGYDAQVAAFNRALAGLSAEIAAGIKAQVKK